MVVLGFEGGGQGVEQVAALLAAGFDDGQQGLDEAAAGGLACGCCVEGGSERDRSHSGHTITWHRTANIRFFSDSCRSSEQTLLVEHFLRSKRIIYPELLNANLGNHHVFGV